MKNKTAHQLTLAGVIAALYVALTFINPYGFGAVQVRVSEMLTVLPVFTSAAVPGLYAGCLVANLLHPGVHILDIIFGSLATLMAAVLTRILRKNVFAALLPPVVVNALVVGPLVYYCYGQELILPVTMASVGVGQLIACYGGGLMLYYLLRKNKGTLFE